MNPTRKNERNNLKRNSLSGFKGDNNIKDKIQTLMENYIDEYGSDELMEILLKTYQEIGLLEKRLHNLEMSIFHESETKSRDSNSPDSCARKRTISSNRIQRMIALLGRAGNLQP